jgi:AraC-like DNA-binding protein
MVPDRVQPCYNCCPRNPASPAPHSLDTLALGIANHMLGVVAMVGDAKALVHLQEALAGHADLSCVYDAAELARCIARRAPDIIVLDMKAAAQPIVRLTTCQAIERFPATRLMVAYRLNTVDRHALAHLRRLEVWDLIPIESDSPIVTRRRLLVLAHGELADMLVRRMVCKHAPAWIRPFVEWCAEHDGVARPDVGSLCKIGNMRRETLARLCKARGVCPPNHIVSWMLVLRATARMCGSGLSLAAIASELGLASAGALANLFKRRTGQPPTEIRSLGLKSIAERAVREMFGQRPDDISLAM